LHLPVLARARTSGRHQFSDLPVVACDPRCAVGRRRDLITTKSIQEAAEEVDPAGTVVHVCTPPTVRAVVISELASLGFRRVIVEKPLAADTDDLARIIRLRRKYGLHIEVVEPWLTSTLTRRLIELVGNGTLGATKSITIVQNKPRFRRSLATPGHPTAFDVELPHGIGLALRLGGNARVTHAAGFNLVIGDLVVERMGGARVGLRHNSGLRTEISSDLTSPVRERRITIEFEKGSATGHFAVSDDDHHAQLTVTQEGHGEHSVLHDDSLTAWMVQAYRNFHTSGANHARGFAFATEVVQMLSVAKNISADPVVVTAGAEPATDQLSQHVG
jgi:predicted dehydrogenase